jgi:membrane protein YdbS with pleckstrin-like domain
MTTEIKAKLTNLNTMYLGSIDNPFLGGTTLMSHTTFPGTGSALTSTLYSPTNKGPLYMNRILANDTAASSLTSTIYTVLSTTSVAVPTTPNVIVFNVNPDTNAIQQPAYFDVSSFQSTNFNVTDGTRPFTTDINCMDLLLTRSSSSLSQIPEAFFVLQGLYGWYSLLDSVNWGIYGSGQPVTISVPDIASPIPTSTSETSGLIIYNSTVIPQNGTVATQLKSQQLVIANAANPLIGNIYGLMNNIIPFTIFQETNFNPFVARRLVHLYILLFNFNILTTYTTNTNPSVNTDVLQNAIFKLLDALNKNVTDNNNGAFKSIVQAVNNRLNTYNSNITQITKLNDDVTQLTDTISTDNSNLKARLQFQEKFKKYRTIALVMLLVITTGTFVLFTFPMEYKKKLSGGGLLVIIAVVTAFILQYQYNKTLSTEGFSNPYVGNNASEPRTVAATIWDQMKEQTSKYLDNTLILTTTLDSYHLYGNVNQSLLRENSFFYDSKLSLQQKDHNMKDLYSITYINQIRFSSLMNLAISLSLIIAVTVSIALAFEGYPEVRKYVFGLGIFLAVIAIIIYILEITSRVHTDPKQIYWGTNKDLLKTV